MERNLEQSGEMMSDMSDDPMPIIVLKPSSNETISGEIYTIKSELYLPTPETASQLVYFLNEFDPNKPSIIDSIAKKQAWNMELTQLMSISLDVAEKTAVDNDCNILGGIFLTYLRTYGVELGRRIGEMSIRSNDIEFMLTLYPDLTTYFVAKEKLTQKEINFAQGVIINNTGSFKVIEIDGSLRVFSADLLKKTAILKRIFRQAAKHTIPYKKVSVRCNLVHSSESEEELSKHKKLFDSRMQQ